MSDNAAGGFVAIGFHVGATATAYVINGDPGDEAEPILSISEESQWVSISSGLRNEGARAHVDFARQLAEAASKYLAAVERFAAARGEDRHTGVDR